MFFRMVEGVHGCGHGGNKRGVSGYRPEDVAETSFPFKILQKPANSFIEYSESAIPAKIKKIVYSGRFTALSKLKEIEIFQFKHTVVKPL